jgi:hypothetical protein
MAAPPFYSRCTVHRATASINLLTRAAMGVSIVGLGYLALPFLVLAWPSLFVIGAGSAFALSLFAVHLPAHEASGVDNCVEIPLFAVDDPWSDTEGFLQFTDQTDELDPPRLRA